MTIIYENIKTPCIGISEFEPSDAWAHIRFQILLLINFVACRTFICLLTKNVGRTVGLKFFSMCLNWAFKVSLNISYIYMPTYRLLIIVFLLELVFLGVHTYVKVCKTWSNTFTFLLLPVVIQIPIINVFHWII